MVERESEMCGSSVSDGSEVVSHVMLTGERRSCLKSILLALKIDSISKAPLFIGG
jgi:hypothetical protein